MYQELEPARTNTLSLLRKGWWSPVYKLTDNVKDYGELSYSGISKRNATAETAHCTIKFSFEAIFSKTILITNNNGEVIGECTREILSRTRNLTLTSGFSARFYRPSFFSREYVWESDGYGKIMTIQNNFPFTLTTDIQLYSTNTPSKVIPLIIFLGAHLIILRRRKRAIH